MTKLPAENKTNTWTLASLAELEDEMFAKHSTLLAHTDKLRKDRDIEFPKLVKD